jgi:hypothetical protein
MRRRRSQLALASLTVCLSIVTPSALADPGTLSGKLADGKLPSAAAGRAVVRAIRVTDGRVLGATAVPRSGAWKLNLDPGYYVLSASTVMSSKTIDAIAPVQRVRDSRTTRTTVSLKRTKTPRATKKKKRRRSARSAATQSAAVGVRPFTGSDPDLGRGLANMVIGELANARSGDCTATVVEVEHRADVQREIALANSGLVAPNSRVPSGNLIDPAIYVQGTVDHNGATTTWTLDIVDASTGNRIGGDSGTANGTAIFDAPAGIAQRLLDQICGGDYQVIVEINTMILAGTLNASGLMNAVVKARPVAGTEPPTTWTGQENFTINGMSYNTGVPECSVRAAPPTGYVRVEIKRSSTPGMIEVTWGGETFGTADMVCLTNGGPVAVPGSAPPLMPFMLTVPTLIILPESGGTQSVSGGAGGYVNNGTVTVTRLPRGTL